MPWRSNVSLRGRIQAKDAWNLLRPARDTLSQILARFPTWLWFASRLAPISTLLSCERRTQCDQFINELVTQDTRSAQRRSRSDIERLRPASAEIHSTEN